MNAKTEEYADNSYCCNNGHVMNSIHTAFAAHSSTADDEFTRSSVAVFVRRESSLGIDNMSSGEHTLVSLSRITNNRLSCNAQVNTMRMADTFISCSCMTVRPPYTLINTYTHAHAVTQVVWCRCQSHRFSQTTTSTYGFNAQQIHAWWTALGENSSITDNW